MKLKTQIVEMDITDLIKADWNYKTDGTEEQIEILINSIKKDKSVGVLAVREIGDKFEVIDGNHRLEALIRMKAKKVPCENFGDITKATAITIARRRNHKWFDDDLNAYAKIFKEDVIEEYSIEELEKFMPDTQEDMQNLLEVDDFDWDEAEETPKFDEEENLKTIKILVPEETYNLWGKWKEKCKTITGYDTDSKAFEFGIVEAMNGTTEEI